MRRPYYRRDRRRWYVKTDDGSSQIYLGETKREAYVDLTAQSERLRQAARRG